ncbi:DNA repair and recombination protein RAD54 [Capsicum annuum]|nr:DNA repair and recombination protein RAD54 [Capsicum annuum]
MEDEEEALSVSRHGDSSNEYLMEPEDVDIDCGSSSGEDDDDDDWNVETQAGTNSPDEDRKSQNVDALVRGNLIVERQSLLPRVYSVTDAAANLRKPFKPPSSNGYSTTNEHLARRLCARKRFVPWGSTSPTLIAITNRLKAPEAAEIEAVEDNVELPPVVEPLVLWQPEEIAEEGYSVVSITVDPSLVRFLRPHQRTQDACARLRWFGHVMRRGTDALQRLAMDGFREGVQFMFDCVSVALSTFNINGCILADDMCLGKTLQSITLLYTLLRQGYDGKPMALAALACKRRVLLSGTPMQNDLEEFYAMVNFTNPGILGDAAHFRRYFETPIICGREPTTTKEEKKLGSDRSAELGSKVNQFILRRTNALLSNHLPPKVKQTITEEAKQSKILAYITALKKLCNHPKHQKMPKIPNLDIIHLVFIQFPSNKLVLTNVKYMKLICDTIRSGSPGTSGFEDCIRFFPPKMFSGRCCSWTGGAGLLVELSGKMNVLARLLSQLRQKTDDRIVLVSNYTQVYQRQMSKEGLRKVIQQEQRDSDIQGNFLSAEDLRGLFTFHDSRYVTMQNALANVHYVKSPIPSNGSSNFISYGEVGDSVVWTLPCSLFRFCILVVLANELTESDMGGADNGRCHPDAVMPDDNTEFNTQGHQPDQEDIGGFAGVAGYLDTFQSSEKQELPRKRIWPVGDLGHHFSPKSVPDVIFQAASGDEVSFVFTSQADGKLVPVE